MLCCTFQWQHSEKVFTNEKQALDHSVSRTVHVLNAIVILARAKLKRKRRKDEEAGEREREGARERERGGACERER